MSGREGKVERGGRAGKVAGGMVEQGGMAGKIAKWVAGGETELREVAAGVSRRKQWRPLVWFTCVHRSEDIHTGRSAANPVTASSGGDGEQQQMTGVRRRVDMLVALQVHFHKLNNGREILVVSP
ncbi:hypothetical protein Pcinc_007645 [Petrolisthes cinctipes]|uniref:Uncharacterized protein n=1 Tax=Petrolisthes cinctipes TaxID=88211 RepID=A0AAE1KYC5_PETCI|nr:hypothetical protein Pcinc_007645 [Petrolisthes cinctipes]